MIKSQARLQEKEEGRGEATKACYGNEEAENKSEH